MTFGYRPLYIVASDINDALLAGLPILESQLCGGLLREYHCLPWSCYGSVVQRSDSRSSDVQAILNRLVDLTMHQRCHNATLVDFAGNCSMLARFATYKSEHFAHVLILDRPLDELVRNYAYSIRKNLNKAERSGVFVRDADSLSDIEAYCDMAHEVAIKHQRKPYPRDLFRNIFQLMIPAGDARFTLAFQNERPIAGALHLVQNNQVFNWLSVCHHKFLEFRPVESIIASVVEWAVAKGYRNYNFGASPKDALGLMRFKEKWGSKKTSYEIYELRGQSNVARFIFRLCTLGRRVRTCRLAQAAPADISAH
jgi:hypothetical protein